MAFQNYLSNYYTTVDNVFYSKSTSSLTFDLNVYLNASKTVLLAKSFKAFSGLDVINELEAVGVTEPPPTSTLPSDRQTKWCLSLVNCTDAWENHGGYVAVSIPPPEPGASFSWIFESHSSKELYYAKDSGRFYEKGRTDEPWVEVFNPPCKITWDNFFSTKAISAPGTNLYRQIYLWLKTQPGFEEAVEV